MPRPFQKWLSIRRGDIVLEGGSALDEDAIRIAELTGDGGLDIAVEPNPFNLVFINASYYGNVVVIHRALWNKR